MATAACRFTCEGAGSRLQIIKMAAVIAPINGILDLQSRQKVRKIGWGRIPAPEILDLLIQWLHGMVLRRHPNYRECPKKTVVDCTYHCEPQENVNCISPYCNRKHCSVFFFFHFSIINHISFCDIAQSKDSSGLHIETSTFFFFFMCRVYIPSGTLCNIFLLPELCSYILLYQQRVLEWHLQLNISALHMLRNSTAHALYIIWFLWFTYAMITDIIWQL